MRRPKQPPAYLDILLSWLKKEPAAILKQTDPKVAAYIRRANDECWNWEDCGRRAHLTDLQPEELWALVKVSRNSGRRVTPIRDVSHRTFSYFLPGAAQKALHVIDTHLGGIIGGKSLLPDEEDDRARYLIRSLREEAISSSLIEGAATTRDRANDMLRSGRKPKTPDERMILNNFRTIRFLNERKDESMSPELLCDIQRMITEGTLKQEDDAGRFRKPAERIVVEDLETGEPLHVPPLAEDLPDRIAGLCQFANEVPGRLGEVEFVHPAVRAILLHFWLAYDHPFCDGNGRTARALFYWSMLRSGYWLTEYLTISTVIAGQPKKYARAYLDTETDDNDFTYFLHYHLGVIERSIREFTKYLEEKTEELHRATTVRNGPFNGRQKALLVLALKNPAAEFTYTSHANSHGVRLTTARSDLLELERQKLLIGSRTDRAFRFVPDPDIAARLKKISQKRRKQ